MLPKPDLYCLVFFIYWAAINSQMMESSMKKATSILPPPYGLHKEWVDPIIGVKFSMVFIA